MYGEAAEGRCGGTRRLGRSGVVGSGPVGSGPFGSETMTREASRGVAVSSRLTLEGSIRVDRAELVEERRVA